MNEMSNSTKRLNEDVLGRGDEPTFENSETNEINCVALNKTAFCCVMLGCGYYVKTRSFAKGKVQKKLGKSMVFCSTSLYYISLLSGM